MDDNILEQIGVGNNVLPVYLQGFHCNHTSWQRAWNCSSQLNWSSPFRQTKQQFCHQVKASMCLTDHFSLISVEEESMLSVMLTSGYCWQSINSRKPAGHSALPSPLRNQTSSDILEALFQQSLEHQKGVGFSWHQHSICVTGRRFWQPCDSCLFLSLITHKHTHKHTSLWNFLPTKLLTLLFINKTLDSTGTETLTHMHTHSRRPSTLTRGKLCWAGLLQTAVSTTSFHFELLLPPFSYIKPFHILDSALNLLVLPSFEQIIHLLLQVYPFAPLLLELLPQGVHTGLFSQLPQFLLWKKKNIKQTRVVNNLDSVMNVWIHVHCHFH